jgi:hypothetical protein
MLLPWVSIHIFKNVSHGAGSIPSMWYSLLCIQYIAAPFPVTGGSPCNITVLYRPLLPTTCMGMYLYGSAHIRIEVRFTCAIIRQYSHLRVHWSPYKYYLIIVRILISKSYISKRSLYIIICRFWFIMDQRVGVLVSQWRVAVVYRAFEPATIAMLRLCLKLV